MKVDISSILPLLDKDWKLFPDNTIEYDGDRPDYTFYSDYAAVGFVFAENADYVLNCWESCQIFFSMLKDYQEVGRLKDLYLVFIIPEEEPDLFAKLQAIINNTYVCRKIIMIWNGKNLRQLLKDIPFLTLIRDTTAKYVEQLNDLILKQVPKKLPQSIMNDLSKHSAKTILNKLLAGEYKGGIKE